MELPTFAGLPYETECHLCHKNFCMNVNRMRATQHVLPILSGCIHRASRVGESEARESQHHMFLNALCIRT